MKLSPPLPTEDELRPRVLEVVERLRRSADDVSMDDKTPLVEAAIFAPQLLDGLRPMLLEVDTYTHPVFYFHATPEDLSAMIQLMENRWAAKDPRDPFSGLDVSFEEILLAVPESYGPWVNLWRARHEITDSSLQCSGRWMTKSGKLRELFLRSSVELDVAEGRPSAGETCIGPYALDETCDRCGSTLFAAVAGRTEGPLAFLAPLGPTVVLPLCPDCVAEQSDHETRVDLPLPKKPIAAAGQKRVVIGRALPTLGAWYRRTSHLGGFPRWAQDPQFPRCPDCRRCMTFIAKFYGDHFGWGYADLNCFACPKCRTMTTLYQQD